MSGAEGRRGRGVLLGGLGLLGSLGILLVSINLRPGASAVGPLLAELRGDLGLSGAVAGLITALPGLCFALVGAVAVALARRIGVTAGIAVGLLAVVIGLGARTATHSAVTFLAFSALALAGMALGNVLVPAWIKRHSRDGGVLGMTAYGTGLTVGGSVGSLTAAPLATAPGGWRFALGVWAATAAVAAVPWIALARREFRDSGDHASPMQAPAGRLWSSRTAVALMLFFGVQSMNAYVQFGWMPQIYRDAGVDAAAAGAWVSLVAGLGIVGGLLMPGFVSRTRHLAPTVVGFGALLVLGYVALWTVPTRAPWLSAILLGLSGWAFPAAIALITARTRNPQITAQVSGFVQPLGYLIAAVGPLLVGIIHDATGGWKAVLILLMASGLVMTATGLVVARGGTVDDELGHRPATQHP